jgi:hypothetical protein
VFATLGGTMAGATLVAQRQHLPPQQVAALEGTFADALHAAFVVSAALAALGVLTAFGRGAEPSSATPTNQAAPKWLTRRASPNAAPAAIAPTNAV